VKLPYLIALDLDGTLLDDKKLILEHTKNFLMKLKKAGHKIVLATGRPIRSFKHYYEQLELDTPVVAYNGAYVAHPSDKQFKEIAFSFPAQVVKAIYHDVGPKYIDNIMCETNQHIWLIKEDNDLDSFFWHKNMNIILGDIRKTLTENPMTMIIKSIHRNAFSDQLIKKAVKKHAGLKLRFWGDSPFSEIYYSHISKASGLKKILKYYDIPSQRLIVFGDAENDKEMLKLARYSFAMLNGNRIAKKSAKKVTTHSNNDNGIFVELKKLIKL
jgi:Cof subfamily protein (haloacid dehalogenase superfamily)